MLGLNPGRIEVVDLPELVIGLVAAVGAPLPLVQRLVRDELEKRGYIVHDVLLSTLIDGVLGESHATTFKSEYERIQYYMDRGNELRSKAGGGEALALLAASTINSFRPQGDVPVLNGHAFILRQLKHPKEVEWLRKIYGEALHIIGGYCPEESRKQNLRTVHGMSSKQAETLVGRDESEEIRLGQQLRDTFHVADVFVPLLGDEEATARQIGRYFRLLFADLVEGVETPTRDEFGMFMASSAALRSADLSRQVGAALLTPKGDIVSVGCNEVPCGGGGQYWTGDSDDARDYRIGGDANARKKEDILNEVVTAVCQVITVKDEYLMALKERLRASSLMDLTEFSRATHAEMEALLSAARNGSSVRECTLYTTTFPCHNCAKHIVGAGIERVVYVEPYPKSLALELHKDSILRIDAKSHDLYLGRKVKMDAFVGVAPRRYWTLFSVMSADGVRLARKDAIGTFDPKSHGVRYRSLELNYMQREASAAALLRTYVQPSDNGGGESNGT